MFCQKKKKKSKSNVRKAFNYISANNKHFVGDVDFLIDLTFIVINFEYPVLKFLSPEAATGGVL